MSVDMGNFIAPRSDQLNADDLIAGPRTIRITNVRTNGSNADQPVAIHFEGDNNKPYLACKSMRRLMVHVWGADTKTYIGRSMTLYCDPEVQFGGNKVGGIRISHMSHIDEPKSVPLTTTRARRALFTVQPLRPAAAGKSAAAAPSTSSTTTATPPYPTVAEYEACKDADTLKQLKARSRETWKQTPTDEAPLIQAASKRASARIAAQTSDSASKSTQTLFDKVQLDGTEATAIAALEAAYKNGRESLLDTMKQIEADYATRKEPIPLAVDAKCGELNEALKE